MNDDEYQMIERLALALEATARELAAMRKELAATNRELESLGAHLAVAIKVLPVMAGELAGELEL